MKSLALLLLVTTISVAQDLGQFNRLRSYTPLQPISIEDSLWLDSLKTPGTITRLKGGYLWSRGTAGLYWVTPYGIFRLDRRDKEIPLANEVAVTGPDSAAGYKDVTFSDSLADANYHPVVRLKTAGELDWMVTPDLATRTPVGFRVYGVTRTGTLYFAAVPYGGGIWPTDGTYLPSSGSVTAAAGDSIAGYKDITFTDELGNTSYYPEVYLMTSTGVKYTVVPSISTRTTTGFRVLGVVREGTIYYAAIPYR